MEFLQFNGETYGNNNNISAGKKRGAARSNFVTAMDDFNVPVKQRSQANARERDRTHSNYCFSVNTAFSTLRTLIPTEPKDRKLSKIETLRLASSYISHLGTQLMAGPIDQPCLRIPKPLQLDEEINQNRQQVCTFCISHKKPTKTSPNETYECPAFSSQIFLNTELLPNDLHNIYYQ
ncbi:unnamed protein product [Brassicogethes aeneus]|uniref:BHLH domain-containing protein n=1 Tax=Brassicogethes aeneus TaxID=1431903 RepID=A0A9P0AUA8_BRAAE|nr:unnamed protein product [Brassicogethes aeneus]